MSRSVFSPFDLFDYSKVKFWMGVGKKFSRYQDKKSRIFLDPVFSAPTKIHLTFKRTSDDLVVYDIEVPRCALNMVAPKELIFNDYTYDIKKDLYELPNEKKVKAFKDVVNGKDRAYKGYRLYLHDYKEYEEISNKLRSSDIKASLAGIYGYNNICVALSEFFTAQMLALSIENKSVKGDKEFQKFFLKTSLDYASAFRLKLPVYYHERISAIKNCKQLEANLTCSDIKFLLEENPVAVPLRYSISDFFDNNTINKDLEMLNMSNIMENMEGVLSVISSVDNLDDINIVETAFNIKGTIHKTCLDIAEDYYTEVNISLIMFGVDGNTIAVTGT